MRGRTSALLRPRKWLSVVSVALCDPRVCSAGLLLDWGLWVSLSLVPPRVDTVGIAFPVSDWDRVGCDVQVKGFGTPTEGYRYSRRLAGGGFLATGAGNSAWVEASLPKRVSEDNNEGLGWDDAIDALEGLYSEALGFVDGSTDASFLDCKVVRLDLVRDFRDVSLVGPLLDGLAGVSHPGRTKVRRFADPARGAAETLRVGPKAWGCTLYDKFRETLAGRGVVAPEGSLRFETRLHQDQLSSVWAKNSGGHMRVVEDLLGHDGRGEERCAVLSRNWFARAGFDREVRGGSALEHVVASCGLSPARTGALWAYLTLPGYGDSLSINARRFYRRAAEQLGLVPGEPSAELSRRSVLRLDYELGTLVAA